MPFIYWNETEIWPTCHLRQPTKHNKATLLYSKLSLNLNYLKRDLRKPLYLFRWIIENFKNHQKLGCLMARVFGVSFKCFNLKVRAIKGYSGSHHRNKQFSLSVLAASFITNCRSVVCGASRNRSQPINQPHATSQYDDAQQRLKHPAICLLLRQENCSSTLR